MLLIYGCPSYIGCRLSKQNQYGQTDQSSTLIGFMKAEVLYNATDPDEYELQDQRLDRKRLFGDKAQDFPGAFKRPRCHTLQTSVPKLWKDEYTFMDDCSWDNAWLNKGKENQTQ